MIIYIKECLYVLDYKDNIVDTIFLSDDKVTAGYAYDIEVEEANTGYSNLSFTMPNYTINSEGESVYNTKLANLKALTKIRYSRTIMYNGLKPITVREPEGYGDTTTYIDKTYTNEYPDNIIEDYVMDYIIEPVEKTRDSLEISTTYTAMDYPRFTLSKKKVGLEISTETLTEPEWSIYSNEPMSVAGTIQYQAWDESYSAYSTTYEWDPANAVEYPLVLEDIASLMQNTAVWPYGFLGTAFYWPIVSTARFDGVMYNEGGWLVLQMYDFYSLYNDEEVSVDAIDRYSWEWSQLSEMKDYLTPNRADNYLHHILQDTNWTVKQIQNDEGEWVDDVDIEQVEVSNPAGSTESTTLTDSTCSISVSGSNCYNAISSVAAGLQLYPIFDCVNRTVSLKLHSGKNYGLVYRLGSNIESVEVNVDGTEVITKLYVTGGSDSTGSYNINIGSAERSYTQVLNGFYTSAYDLPTGDFVSGVWAVVDPALDADYYWIAGEDRAVYFYNNSTDTWALGTLEETGNWSAVVGGIEYIVDPTSGAIAPWNPNDDMYIQQRSPYGTNYIINLQWHYDNGWITKEEILDFYRIMNNIQLLNEEFIDDYTTDRIVTLQDYYTAVNNYDIEHDSFTAAFYGMQNKYYKEADSPSSGSVYAFPNKVVDMKSVSENGGTANYVRMCHCSNKISGAWCGYTTALTPTGTAPTVCPYCGSSDYLEVEEIYTSVYDDAYTKCDPSKDPLYPYGTGVESAAYDPKIKGTYQRLVTTLSYDEDSDDSGAELTVEDYIDMVSIVTPMELIEGVYVLKNGSDYVYVRSSSGYIETWNDYIADYIEHYGNYKDALQEVNDCLEKISILDDLYDEWETQYNSYEAELQEKYGDYIVEGSYANTEQPYVGLLFDEGMEASEEYAIPQVTYSLSVVDSSGLVEYRQSRLTEFCCSSCGYSTVKIIDECPKCGCTSILTVLDTYNDLVNVLHSAGQIVPKAGDYVTVYDEPMGLYGVPALITSISRTIDNPVDNEITLDTSYTDDDELVGNIITATNTVLDNSDIYARTAILNSDGTIDSSSIQTTLDDSTANITIVGSNGNMILSGAGLQVSDPSDSTKGMKYTGTGVYSTTTLAENGEGTTWENVLSTSGINASYINTGTIDASQVNILSGGYGKVMLDEHGLVVKADASKSSYITSFSSTSAMASSSYASTWGTTNNIASFVGVDNDNNALIYTKGFLVANEGSNIANWITSDSGFYHLNGTTKDLWLSPTGITGAVNGTSNLSLAIYANGNFGVTTSGYLYASNVNLSGAITATSGKIGAFTISDTGTIYGGSGANKLGLMVYEDSSSVAFFAGSYVSGADSAPFRVLYDGTLYATNANISGTITASSGTIGGWTVSSTSLSGSGKISGGTISGSYISSGTITGGSITGSEIYIGSDATGSDFFAVGCGTNDPVASALSVRDGYYLYSSLTHSSHQSSGLQGGLRYDGTNGYISLELNGDVGFTLGNVDSTADSAAISLGADSDTIALHTNQGTITLEAAYLLVSI